MFNVGVNPKNRISNKNKSRGRTVIFVRVWGKTPTEPIKDASRPPRHGRFYLAGLDHNGGPNQSVLRIEPQTLRSQEERIRWGVYHGLDCLGGTRQPTHLPSGFEYILRRKRILKDDGHMSVERPSEKDSKSGTGRNPEGLTKKRKA